MRIEKCAVVAALLGSGTAWATDGLEWKFDAPVRYHLDVRVHLPQAFPIQAQENLEAAFTEYEAEVVTTCAALEATKNGWELGCLIDAISVRAVPIDSSLGRLLPILVEADDALTGATVQFLFGRDGRVRDVELVGLDMKADDRRASEREEGLRLLMVRTFAPLDLQLPKKGDDGGKGAWRQRESLIFGFPSGVGALGSATIGHEIAEVTGDLIDLRSTGSGVIGAGESVAVAGTERVANMYDMRMEGTARFDRSTGRLLSRDYTARGTLTASSVDAAAGAGSPYVQVGSLRWLVDDAPVPDLGATGEVADTGI